MIKILPALLLLAFVGCQATGALQAVQAGTPQVQQLVTQLSLAPLGTCVAVVSGANSMIAGLKQTQPPVLPP